MGVTKTAAGNANGVPHLAVSKRYMRAAFRDWLDRLFGQVHLVQQRFVARVVAQ
jgi:hypothetical protein